jgi:hypothetical protein
MADCKLQTLNRKAVGGSPAEGPRSTWEIVKSPGVTSVLSIYGGTMLLALAYTAGCLPDFRNSVLRLTYSTC